MQRSVGGHPPPRHRDAVDERFQPWKRIAYTSSQESVRSSGKILYFGTFALICVAMSEI